MGGRARGGRAAFRFAGAVLATTGILTIVDVGITLAWEEPISAFLNSRSQDALRGELADAERGEAQSPRAPLPVRATRFGRGLRSGDAAGRIELPALHRSYVFVQGTGAPQLREGPGHYADTPLPGRHGTVGIAGHRTTHGAPFRTIDKLGPGDAIRLVMPYGRFTYRVERTRIVEPDDVSVKRTVGFDRLVLTACHPLYSADQRIVVFARLATAPSSRDSSRSTTPTSRASDTTSTASQ